MWRIHEINGLAKILPIVLNSSNLVCGPFRVKLYWFYCKCDLYCSFVYNRSLNPRKFIPEAGWSTNYPPDLQIILLWFLRYIVIWITKCTYLQNRLWPLPMIFNSLLYSANNWTSLCNGINCQLVFQSQENYIHIKK